MYTKQAQKDAQKIASAGLKEKALEILNILEKDTYQSPPSCEKLVGDLTGAWLRRINIQHRIVFQIYDKEQVVKIIRMWTHFE